MKVVASPLTFITGDVLDPADLNELYDYAADAIADVATKRYTPGILAFPLEQAVGTGYTEAGGQLLVWRFKCPNTCVVTGSFLSATLTCSAAVTVTITTSAGAEVSGASSPLLTTGGALSSDDVTDASFDRFTLTAGTEYLLTVAIAGGGTFTFASGDIVLHTLTDRWCPSDTTSVPAPSLIRFTDASPPDADDMTANNDAISTAVALFASNVVAPAPVLLVAHNFINTTDADVLTFTIPRSDSARSQCRIVRIYAWAVMAATTGTSVTATLKDQAGATLTTVTVSVAGVTQASADSGALTTSLVSATTNISTTTASDYSLVFANANGTNCIRAHALVLVSR